MADFQHLTGTLFFPSSSSLGEWEERGAGGVREKNFFAMWRRLCNFATKKNETI